MQTDLILLCNISLQMISNETSTYNIPLAWQLLAVTKGSLTFHAGYVRRASYSTVKGSAVSFSLCPSLTPFHVHITLVSSFFRPHPVLIFSSVLHLVLRLLFPFCFVVLFSPATHPFLSSSSSVYVCILPHPFIMPPLALPHLPPPASIHYH